MGTDYEKKKDDKVYKMWVRPTIPWKLECEQSKPKSVALDAMLGAEASEMGLDRCNSAIMWIALAVLFGTGLGTAGTIYYTTKGDDQFYIALSGCGMIVC